MEFHRQRRGPWRWPLASDGGNREPPPVPIYTRQRLTRSTPSLSAGGQAASTAKKGCLLPRTPANSYLASCQRARQNKNLQETSTAGRRRREANGGGAARLGTAPGGGGGRVEEGALDQPGGQAARRACQAARRRAVELRLQACRYCICMCAGRFGNQ